MSRGFALPDGAQASAPNGQVRIYVQGGGGWSGTLVDRNWVLTAAHGIDRPDNPSAYSVRFGTTTAGADTPDNLRVADRIIVYPAAGDMAMIHFSNPVPTDTFIAPLTDHAPARYSGVRQYGWGPNAQRLVRDLGLVIDPAATANADKFRSTAADFSAVFPSGIDPLVTNIRVEPGDSGGGLFDHSDSLIGVGSGGFPYQIVGASGQPIGRTYLVAFLQPVWKYLTWIRQVLNGEGSSSPPKDELKRRRLSDTTTTDPVMSPAPQVTVCENGLQCDSADQYWQTGKIGGAVLAHCANSDCWVATIKYPQDTSPNLKLAGSRHVIAWCTSRITYHTGEPLQQAVRVSFLNDDNPQASPDYGWWDVSPTAFSADSAAHSLPACEA
jgi:hypothetical protein